MTMGRPQKPFEHYVRRTDGCWFWIGHTASFGGYGKYKVKSRFVFAHRIAWERKFGPIPKGLSVCHHCDNPSCVRPDHLFVGTMSDNIRDSMNKGRLTGLKAMLTSPNRNALTARKFTLQGKSQTIREWAAEFGTSKHVLRDRLEAGWAMEKALMTPTRTCKRKDKRDNVTELKPLVRNG